MQASREYPHSHMHKHTTRHKLTELLILSDLSCCIYMGAIDFSVHTGYQGNMACIIQQLSLVLI